MPAVRESRRQAVLVAAVAVVERDGVRGLTLDAVAAETGMTKPGLLYHFPTREHLLAAVQEHVARTWDDDMADLAGGRPEDVTARARQAAYVRLCAAGTTRAELLLVLESLSEPGAHPPWAAAVERWAPTPAEDADDDEVRAFLARLAADGLWMHEASSGSPLPAGLRRRLVEALEAVPLSDRAACGPPARGAGASPEPRRP